MSTALQQPAHDATTFRLTDMERDKLWRLFDPVSRDLACIAAGMLRFRSVADGMDVVQEAFVSFARRATRSGLRCLDNKRIADIDDSELEQWIPPCRAYLISVVVRKCCWIHRKERLRPLVIDEWVEKNVPGREPDPADESSRQESVNKVKHAVLSLPEHLCKVVTLRYYGRCSDEQIAAALGIPKGTVKSRLHSSRKQLRCLLSSEMVLDIP